MAVAGVCRLIFSLSTLALTWGWRCSVEQDVCDVWLTIEHRATMMDASTLVIIKDGLLFPFDAVNFTIDNSIPKEKVLIYATVLSVRLTACLSVATVLLLDCETVFLSVGW